MALHYLPLFPLQIVVFETEELRLHIFEPRYKKLVNECLSQNLEFGIPLVYKEEIQSSGCAVRIERVGNVYANGELDIVCKGTRRFELIEFLRPDMDSNAAGGLVDFVEFSDNEDKELNLRITDLMNEIISLNNIEHAALSHDDFVFIKWIHKYGLSTEKELELAMLTSTAERQLYIISHLKEMLATQSGVQRMRSRIQLNGHFQKPEQKF